MDILTTILTSAGATTIFLVAAARLGWAWINQQFRSRANQELERVKNELQGEMDVLVRRRDVYAKLAHEMRVFLRVDNQLDQVKQAQQLQNFLKAYDEVCLWGAESVVNQLGELLDLSLVEAEAQAAATNLTQHNAQKLQAYQACIEEMRRDSGFPDTAFRYRVVGF